MLKKVSQKSRWWDSLKRGIFLGGMTLIAAILGAAIAFSFATNPLLKQPLTPQQAAIFTKTPLTQRTLGIPQFNRPVNILVMGMSVLSSDVPRPPASTRKLGYKAQVNSFEGLTDVLTLVHFDPKTNGITTLSIPRDTRIVTQRNGTIKINAANVIGGAAASASVVSQLLYNVPIDRYARVNVLGIKALVDALGGVTVTIPRDLKYTDESQHLYINLKAGRRHLNGEQTLQLLRFRHDSRGDIGRLERQQLVIQALLEQKVNPLVLFKLPQVLSVIKTYTDSNLQGDEIMATGIFGAKNRQNVRRFMLPGRVNGTGRVRVSYWLPDEAGIQQLVEQYLRN